MNFQSQNRWLQEWKWNENKSMMFLEAMKCGLMLIERKPPATSAISIVPFSINSKYALPTSLWQHFIDVFPALINGARIKPRDMYRREAFDSSDLTRIASLDYTSCVYFVRHRPVTNLGRKTFKFHSQTHPNPSTKRHLVMDNKNYAMSSLVDNGVDSWCNVLSLKERLRTVLNWWSKIDRNSKVIK